MKKLFCRLIAFAVLLSVASSAFAQIFYKVEGNGAKDASYIFGTHHLAPLSILNNYPSLAAACDSAEAVVGEIDMTQGELQMMMAMQPYMTAPADSTLFSLLSPEEFNDLNQKFLPYSPQPGVDLNVLGGMKPMVISSIVAMGEIAKDLPGFNPSEQLDKYFQTKFAAEGKEVVALETPDMQASLLYGFFPIAKQLADLRELLGNPSELAANATRLNEAYLKGDLEAMQALTEQEDSDPAFMNALSTIRNRDWLQKLPALINSKHCMIVVGALHLAGDDGIVEGLRRMGYTVTPIN
ncbi:MAG: TraB/GumN family protein [Muribaculaceae bacterium]|nr:TraB/GumN family protein [Muribaculaceae bacterium]